MHGRLIATAGGAARPLTASDLIHANYCEVNDELITAGVEALQNLDDGHRGSAHDCPHRRLVPTWSYPCSLAVSVCSPFQAFERYF